MFTSAGAASCTGRHERLHFFRLFFQVAALLASIAFDGGAHATIINRAQGVSLIPAISGMTLAATYTSLPGQPAAPLGAKLAAASEPPTATSFATNLCFSTCGSTEREGNALASYVVVNGSNFAPAFQAFTSEIRAPYTPLSSLSMDAVTPFQWGECNLCLVNPLSQIMPDLTELRDVAYDLKPLLIPLAAATEDATHQTSYTSHIFETARVLGSATFLRWRLVAAFSLAGALMCRSGWGRRIFSSMPLRLEAWGLGVRRIITNADEIDLSCALTPSMVRQRGWSPELMVRFLGRPDYAVVDPRRIDDPIILISKRRIEAVERSPRFVDFLKRQDLRIRLYAGQVESWKTVWDATHAGATSDASRGGIQEV